MFLGQTIKMCFKNIISNKLRSFLTMLGIIIGISSVIILVGFTQGTSEDISSSLQNLGANVLTVNIYNDDTDSLNYKDLKNDTFNFVEDVVMTNSTRINAKVNDTSSTYTFMGVTPNYLEVQKLSNIFSPTGFELENKVCTTSLPIKATLELLSISKSAIFLP